MHTLTTQSNPELRTLNADEVDAVCGAYAGQTTFYEMGGHIYAVYHNKSGRATGTEDLGATSTF